MLKGKHILIGITGSIAAYKTATLVRYLVKEGAEVKIIMTEMAKEFITPLTMATLSKNPILVDFYNPENGDWNSHISLGMWAHLYIIAPASANTMAKMVTGIADNLLLTSFLSARCPVMIAPAMDVDMYEHIATQTNISTLKKRGVIVIAPSSGELASGLEGKGRMEEPEIIVESIKDFFLKTKTEKSSGKLAGKKVVITAGPTVEQIDPVRYISNYSTGKMGYAIANEFASRGAQVTIISGPVGAIETASTINIIKVKSAQQMQEATLKEYNNQIDIVVLAAAVSDYTPLLESDIKLKRKGDNLKLSLKPTADIAASIGEIKKRGVFHLGFALETNNETENACKKLKSKNLDAIVLNSLQDKGAGFAVDTNKVTIIDSKNNNYPFPLKSKKEVASDIVDFIENSFIC